MTLGRTLGGWVASRRRSRLCPAARAIRYIVDIEHQYRPSSSSRAHTCGIARSAYPGAFSTARTCSRSAGLSVHGGGVRGSHGPCIGPTGFALR
jgi:hypothetical protein